MLSIIVSETSLLGGFTQGHVAENICPPHLLEMNEARGKQWLCCLCLAMNMDPVAFGIIPST